jgi:hypothetical protein
MEQLKAQIQIYLKNNLFLNDSCINFFVSFLIEKFRMKDHVKWIDPTSVNILTNEKMRIRARERKTIESIFSFSDLEKYKVILIPVHDITIEQSFSHFERLSNRIRDRSPGDLGHWSLLIYYTTDNTVYHYDSLAPTNNLYVIKLMNLLLDNTDNFVTTDTILYQYPVPAQDAYWQCGYLVVTIAELTILKMFGLMKEDLLGDFEPLTRSEIEARGNITSKDYCDDLRKKLLNLSKKKFN